MFSLNRWGWEISATLCLQTYWNHVLQYVMYTWCIMLYLQILSRSVWMHFPLEWCGGVCVCQWASANGRTGSSHLTHCRFFHIFPLPTSSLLPRPVVTTDPCHLPRSCQLPTANTARWLIARQLCKLMCGPVWWLKFDEMTTALKRTNAETLWYD